MKAMISDTLENIVSEFKTEINDTCLCSLKTIRFDQGVYPDYTKSEIQKLYLLRYYPAYLCEYKYLYKKVLRSRKIKNLFILSVGCGCGVDYQGAFLANGRNFNNITYHGIDLVKWSFSESLGNPNYDIILGNINEMEFPPNNKYNIIMFPKSISEFDDESFDSFLAALSESTFTEDIIYLISSVMDKGFESDSNQYKKVADFLIGIGYKCDEYEETQEIKGKGGLINLDGDFDYPNDIKDFIITLSTICKTFKSTNKNCQPDCKTQLNKWPILKSDYISFQFNCFERTK